MEVLACPHCDRLFQVTLATLGKKIRCRGCLGIFHVPRDTTSVPLASQERVSNHDDSLPPLAIPCVVDCHDARSCPECGRTFRMQDSFAGKTIRCRGCKIAFRVSASEPSSAKPMRPESASVKAHGTDAPPAPSRPVPAAPLKGPPPQAAPPPTIFEDIGDVLDDLLPGEKVPSVVRPRTVRTFSRAPSTPVVTMAAVVFGGFCAVPATLIILRILDKKRFDDVALMLPDFLVGWLR